MPANDNIQTPTLEIPIEIDMESARRSLKEIEREFKQSGDRAGQGMEEAGGETKKFTQRLKDAAVAAGGLAALVGRRLLSGLKGLGRVVGGVTSFFVDLTALGILGVSRGLHRLDVELEDNGRAWKTVGDVAGGTATVLDKVGGTLIRVSAILTGMKIAAAGATAAMVVMANRAAGEFTAGFNRVRTLLPPTVTGIRELRTQVNAMTGDLGAAADEANDTLYQVLSAMPDLVDEPTRALGVLRVALEAGSTGFADSAEAAAATTAVLNAFGKEAEDAREVADALFATQNQGVTTFGEVASSIGRVANLASSLDAAYEDLLGITATLTPKGQETAEVFTQVRATLLNILKPTADAKKAARELGIEFDAQAVRAKGLNRFLIDLIEATEGNPDVLARFFGSTEALNLVVSLASATDELQQKTHAIANSAGTTARAVRQMNDGWERQKEILAGQLKAELREIGFLFENIGTVGLKAINGIIAAMRFFAGRDEDGLFPELNERLRRANEARAQERARRGVDIMARRLEFREAFQAHISKRAAENLTQLVENLERESKLFEAGTPARQEFVDLLDQARERLDYVNRKLEEHAGAAGRAAAADAEFVSRQRELEQLIFGERLARPAPKETGPIRRPAEPTSVEYSRFKIGQMEAVRQLQAVRELARTGDMEAYEAATREAQEAVNDLVLAEIDRLEAAGASEADLAELARLYQVLADRTEAAARARRSLQEELDDRLFRLTADAIDLQVRSLDQLEARFREVYGEELPEQVKEGLERLRQNVERSRVLATFQDQFRQLQQAPATLGTADAMAELYHQLKEEADQLPENQQLREDYLALLEQIAAAIDRIRDARRQERQEDAKTSEEQARRAREEELRQLRDRARTIEENARAALDLAGAMGAVDAETERALDTMITLGASLSRVIGGDMSALPAAIASAASLITQLFGGARDPDQARREREYLDRLQQNTEALERLRQNIESVRDAFGRIPGGVIAGFPEAFERALEAGEIQTTDRDGRPTTRFSTPAFMAALERELEAMGLTMEDLEAAAEALNIEWDGSIGQMEVLVQALRELELEKLTQTYAGAMELLRTEFDLFDIEDPIEQIRRMLAVFEKFSDVPIPEFDLSTEEGRAAAEAWIQEMFRQIQSGEFDVSQLGPDVTLDDFLQMIAEFERRLDEAASGGVVGGADTTRLGVSITEVQASQLISLDVTRNYILRDILAALGGTASLPSTAVPAPSSLGLDRTVSDSIRIDHLDIDVDMPIHTTGGVSRRELEAGGRAAGEAMAAQLAKQLGRKDRSQGKLGAPKIVREHATR